jgi:hypothetical protein
MGGLPSVVEIRELGEDFFFWELGFGVWVSIRGFGLGCGGLVGVGLG